jgi:hypothetical protein
MNTPDLGDSITLYEHNRDQVILFIRKCSDGVSAYKPCTEDEPPVIDPNATHVVLEGVYNHARVDVGETVVRTGEDQITILAPNGGKLVLDLEKSEVDR